MDVTNRDYHNFADNIERDIYDVPEVLERLEAKIKTKIERELEAIKNNSSTCPVYIEDKFRINIAGIKDQKVKDQITRDFYNPEIMKAAACAIDAMYYSPKDNQGIVSINRMIRERITGMKVLGSGVSGTAAAASIGDADDVAVVKFPNRATGVQDTTHELFIATVGGINSLRNGVPNFAYIFGGFRCPPPTVGTDGEIVGWCSEESGSGDVQFLLMENISPSISALKYIKGANGNQTMSLYFQVIFALEYASRKIDFTHYDAHTENVIMRDISAVGLGGVFTIPYQLASGKTYYVKTDRVATFIDYGMAGARYKGDYYGLYDYGRMDMAIFNDRSWPLHDAYKFLMFLIMDASEARNREALSVLIKIFRFFNKSEDPLKLARYSESDSQSQWPQRFALPYIKKATRYTLGDLLEYMFTNLNHRDILFTTKNSRYKVLECGSCVSFEGALKIMGSDSDINPKTFFEFYDLDGTLNGETMLEVAQNFNYKNAKGDWQSKVEDLKNEAKALASEVRRIDLRSFPLQRSSTVKMLQKSYYNIYKLVSLTEDIELQAKIGSVLADWYDDDRLHQYIIGTDFSIYRRILCELVGHAVLSYEIIKEFMDSPNWRAHLRNNRDLRWYNTHAGAILDLQTHACLSESLAPPPLAPSSRYSNTGTAYSQGANISSSSSSSLSSSSSIIKPLTDGANGTRLHYSYA